MKKLALFTLVAALFMQTTPAHAGLYRDLNTWVEKNSPLDQNLHIGAGVGISHILKQNGASTVVSMLVPATLGFVKESTDRNFSNSDLLSWVAGGIVGALLDDTGIKISADAENGVSFLVYLD
ncbi:hypothetical protein [Prosthecochloris sp. GSB1]|uniref:hypothetical protein n=1 Tax=Prosthecochloris sp. GSB1 TaxID=281093 RepID=UPI0012376B73|nr:hypothetical protein [Prosthecochloris sp. GSB1]